MTNSSTPMNRGSTPRLCKVWDAVDTALWIVLGIGLIYYGDGRTSLPSMLYEMDDRIDRQYLVIGFVLAAVNGLIFLYLHFWCGCWMGWEDVTPEKVAPWSLPCGVVSMVGSLLCFMIAWKGVFGWMVLLNMPLLGVFFTTILDWIPFIRGKCGTQSNQMKHD